MLLRLIDRNPLARLLCSMSDVHNAPPADPGAGGNPPATPPASPGAPAPAPVPARPSGQSDAERAVMLEREIANTRAEAASYRIDARAAKEKITAMENEIAVVRNEANRRIADAESSGQAQLRIAQNRIIDSELKAAAVASGLVDPDLLPLIDKSKIVYNQDGSVAGIPEAIANFKTSKPQFFREGTPAPAPRTTTTGSPAPAPQPAPLSATPTGGGPAPARSMDKTAYDQSKRDAIAGLRRGGR